MENLKHISSNEITLYSDVDPRDVVLNQADFVLEQSHKTRGVYRKISIFVASYGTYCHQLIRNKHQKKLDFRIDLAYLDPIPVRKHQVASQWAYCSLGLALLSGLMIWTGWFSNSMNPSISYMVSTITVSTLTLISLLLFAHNSYDRIIFQTQHGNVQLIELLNKYPDKESFRQFIGQFILSVKNAKKNKRLSPSRFLAGELRELRRLRDEAVISAETYEIAKAELFQNESYQTTIPRILH